jgi:hypothetical protein
MRIQEVFAKQRANNTLVGRCASIGHFERLEARLALSASSVIDEITDGSVAAEWKVDPSSPEYLSSIEKLRNRLGWKSDTPVLLENGNWYFGSAGP